MRGSHRYNSSVNGRCNSFLSVGLGNLKLGGAMFSERRVAQMAAYLLGREKGRMNYLKLIKLLYLADRESLKRHGHPISDDRYVSMDHGPVLSTTFNLIKGAV